MTQREFSDIPSRRPVTTLLDSIESPADLRELSASSLITLADELREFLLYTVGQTGGHFGAGLGVVELTIALHKIFNTPEDRIVWDVGHQCYPHKILTGRREAMASLRQQGGIAGFPKRSESAFDTFGVGHSSTSISAALGMAIANANKNDDRHCVAVIGDGAMTAGMAFEALNHASHSNANLLVILNDNQMSISKNEGGLASYFAKIWASKTYSNVREGGKKVLSHLPQPAQELARKTEEHLKGMVSPATLFEELGFNYIGPMDGHDLPLLLNTLNNMREFKGPQLLHIMTQKGQGFAPAVADPIGYHAISKIAAASERQQPAQNAVKAPKYQDVFGQWLCDTAAEDQQLIAITPAMCEGSGMLAFAQQYPERFHDVAIAEQHAVTFAAGLACDNSKPVVAIYSTFLQRAYDQLIHDVALQNLDVLFAIDRAGLVGEDGPSHAGSFDLSYLRCIPNMLIATPSDENETRLLLNSCYHYPGPAAVRYPRGQGTGVIMDAGNQRLEIGKAKLLRESDQPQVLIVNFGTLLKNALPAAEHFNATVLDMRFVKPLDTDALQQHIAAAELVVTLEENAVMGGAGSAVVEYMMQAELIKPVLQLGLPDQYIDHGKHSELLQQCELSSEAITARIAAKLEAH
ncbi:MAG: 1-deoxy-D-xylulose-5-phosphate synthase [Pseudomonadales bacterium]|nr:1-deoxy-D-xylulose-5-phosphate synthase [Pseudomonadales bacterium]